VPKKRKKAKVKAAVQTNLVAVEVAVAEVTRPKAKQDNPDEK
jgi:hypothetical protein